MTTLAKLERDQDFNPMVFNMNFEENEKTQEIIDKTERENEMIKKKELEKQNEELQPVANIIPKEIYDFGIDMSRLLFKMIDSISKKENPMTYIMCNNSECKRNQLIFSIMLLFFGLLLFFLANILS